MGGSEWGTKTQTIKCVWSIIIIICHARIFSPSPSLSWRWCSCQARVDSRMTLVWVFHLDPHFSLSSSWISWCSFRHQLLSGWSGKLRMEENYWSKTSQNEFFLLLLSITQNCERKSERSAVRNRFRCLVLMFWYFFHLLHSSMMTYFSMWSKLKSESRSSFLSTLKTLLMTTFWLQF